MKYWVYKESRIIGPFDKEGVSGLPGVDSGTLVCAGDPAAGGWVPAGEVAELGALSSPPSPFSPESPDSTSLLDRLQLDTAGLVDDDDLTGSLADDLFRDAGLKTGFADALTSRPADDAELKRARDKAAELTFQLESMFRRVSELEAGHAELARRLAEKELEVRRLSASGGLAPAPGAFAPPPPFAAPAVEPPPPDPLKPPPQSAVPALPAAGVAPSTEWPKAPEPGGIPGLPSFSPPAAAGPAIPEPPPMPSFSAPVPAGDQLPPPPPPAGDLPPPPTEGKPKTLSFGKPKTFKVVPTVKSFKVIGSQGAAAPASTPSTAGAPPAPAPTPAPVVPPAPTPADLAPTLMAPPALTPPPPASAPEIVIQPPVPAPAPEAAAPPPSPFASVEAPAAAPAPTPAPEFAALDPLASLATPTPPPPNTLSQGPVVSDMAGGDMASAEPAGPPATMARSGAPAGVPDAVLARFAKPEAAPPTEPPKIVPRSNKPFLIGGAVLVALLGVVGYIFMRQPRDEMKQMTSLDDGQGKIGLPALDEGSAPPMAKPRPAEPAPVPAPPPEPAPPPGPPPEQQAAIDLVKDFPLDGGRGTVGRWLQYSYTASPGAGAEEWSVSATGDTWLVEYKMNPGAQGGNGALYLFEADTQRGLVMGKNLEARRMLAGGGPPAEPEPAKKKAAPKKAKKKPARRPVVEETEVPLLPLPDSGELRPPSEDDGSFGSDTINQGI